MRRIAFGIVAAIMGIWMLWWGWNTRHRIVEAAHWPSSPGMVTASSIKLDSTRIRGGGYNRHHVVNVRYEYEVSGKKYTSDVITFGMRYSFPSAPEAEQMLARYPQGQPVTVYFNPHDPSMACLAPGTVPDSVPFIIWSSALFLLAGIFCIVSGIISVRRAFHEWF